MIQVQVAGLLTREGVDGLRWVLVDGQPRPPEAAAPAAGAALTAGGAAPHADAEGRSARAQVLRLLMGWLAMLAGLAVALVAAFLLLGAPTGPVWRDSPRAAEPSKAGALAPQRRASALRGWPRAGGRP